MSPTFLTSEHHYLQNGPTNPTLAAPNPTPLTWIFIYIFKSSMSEEGPIQYQTVLSMDEQLTQVNLGIFTLFVKFFV